MRLYFIVGFISLMVSDAGHLLHSHRYEIVFHCGLHFLVVSDAGHLLQAFFTRWPLLWRDHFVIGDGPLADVSTLYVTLPQNSSKGLVKMNRSFIPHSLSAP